MTTSDRNVHCFKTKEGQLIRPFEFGMNSVTSGMNIFEQYVVPLFASSNSNRDQLQFPVQVQFLPLLSGVYYLYARIVSSGDKDFMTEVSNGVFAGYRAIFSVDEIDAKADSNADSFFQLMSDYVVVLNQDLHRVIDENLTGVHFEISAAAKLFAESVVGQCELWNIHLDLPVMADGIKDVSMEYGILYLLELIKKNHYMYLRC